MTTGTKIVDMRVPTATDCGTALAGFYSSREWSGSDYPPRAIVKNIWVKPRISMRERAVDLPRSGPSSAYNLKYDKFLVEGHYRTIWLKPPKRASIEYHPYQTTWREFFDPVHKFGGSPSSLTQLGTVATCFGWSASTPDPWSNNDTLSLLGKLRETCVGSDFHAGNFLGEGNQCLRMIGDSASKIAKSLKHIKRGNVPGAVRSLFGSRISDKEILRRKKAFYASRGLPPPKVGKIRPGDIIADAEISNLWLSVQYGWLPLLEDVQGAAKMLAHLLDDPLQFRVRVTRNAGGKRLQTPFTGAYGSYRPKIHTVTSRTTILAILSEKDVAKMAGLTDVASVAWEVMPWSFVIDWFIPVGNWLSARGLASALSGKFVTSHKFEEVQRVLDPTYGWQPGYYCSSSPRFYHRRGNFSRTVSTSLSVPFPEVKPLSKALSWLHCSNAVALLSQMSTSGRRS